MPTTVYNPLSGNFDLVVDDAAEVIYTPTTPANWSPAPATTAEALDQLAASSGTSGEANTASNVGVTGEGVFAQKSGVDLQFKKLIAGTNVSLVSTTTGITISSADTGEANTASNLGVTGEGLFAQKMGADLEFKRLVAGPNISLSNNTTSVIIEATGTAPDATTSVKGIVKLAGDLGGTADLPTVPQALKKNISNNASGNITFTTSTPPSGFDAASGFIDYEGARAYLKKIWGYYTDPLLGFPQEITTEYNSYYTSKDGVRLLKNYYNPDPGNSDFQSNYTQLTSDYFSMSYFEDVAAITSAFTVDFGYGGFSLTKDGNAYLPSQPSNIATKAYVDSVTGGTLNVKDEGSTIVSTASSMNFVGDGVTVTNGGSNTAVVTISGGAGGLSSDLAIKNGSFKSTAIGPSLSSVGQIYGATRTLSGSQFSLQVLYGRGCVYTRLENATFECIQIGPSGFKVTSFVFSGSAYIATLVDDVSGTGEIRIYRSTVLNSGWSLRATYTPTVVSTVYSVFVSATLWIVVAPATSIYYTSADGGVTWTSRTWSQAFSPAAMVAGIVTVFSATVPLITAVGNDGGIATSTDGISWTARTSGTVNSLLRVVISSGVLVASGNTGTILTSTNGSTWSTRTSNVTGQIKQFEVGGNSIVLGISSSSRTVIRSSDSGATWSKIGTAPVYQTDTYLAGAIDAPFLLTCGNQIYSEPNSYHYTSYSGESWVPFSNKMAIASGQYSSITWTGTCFIAGGSNNSGLGLTYSLDGTIWKPLDANSFDTTSNGPTLWKSYKQVLGATYNGRGHYCFLTSANDVISGYHQTGITFKSIYRTIGGLGAATAWSDMAYSPANGGTWYIVGTSGYIAESANSATGPSSFVSSTKLMQTSSWNTVASSTIPDSSSEYRTIVFAGGNGQTYLRYGSTSLWETRTLSGLGTSVTDSAYGNGVFVIAGIGGPATTSRVWYSSDFGATFSASSNFFTSATRLKFANGKFYVYGAVAAVFNLYESVDGLTWTVSTSLPATGYIYTDLTYGNGRYAYTLPISNENSDSIFTSLIME